MKIYFGSDFNGQIFGDAYLCRGMLLDCDMHCIPAEHELACPPDWDPSADCEALIYRDGNAVSSDDPWYLSAEEAANAYHVSPDDIIPRLLNTEVIEPLQFPLLVDVQMGEKGPVVWSNTHPELDGRYVKGKIFFPDRSWDKEHICKGPAMVSITKEFTTYGFVKGEMVSFEAQSPEYSDFLDWAWNKRLKDTVVAIVRHPIRGKYYAILDSWRGKYKRVRKDDQTPSGITATFEDIITEDLHSGCKSEISDLYDLFTMASFNMPRSVLCDLFPMCRFYMDKMLDVSWVSSDKMQVPIIEEGIKEGVLTLYQLQGFDIFCVTVSDDSIVNLCSFQVDEAEEMGKAVAKINKDAEEKILSKIRKGHLRVYSRYWG